eukprot:tig00020961_g16723.t1
MQTENSTAPAFAAPFAFAAIRQQEGCHLHNAGARPGVSFRIPRPAFFRGERHTQIGSSGRSFVAGESKIIVRESGPSVSQSSTVCQANPADAPPPPFGAGPKEDALEGFVSSIPGSLRSAAAGLVVAGGVAGGAALVGSVPPKNMAKAGAGAVVALGAVGLGSEMFKKRRRVALNSLHKLLVGEGVSAANDANLDALSAQNGIDVREACKTELCDFYGQYLLHCLWSPELNRQEVDTLRKLRTAFRLDGNLVADTHIKYGRQLFRQLEERAGGSRRKTIGKLLFLSEKVLEEDGEMLGRYVRSSLKDTFNTSEAQLNKIMQEVTGGVFRDRLRSQLELATGQQGSFDVAEARKALRQTCDNYCVGDQEAAYLFVEVASEVAEALVQKAAKAADDLDRRTVVKEFTDLLNFNASLSAMYPVDSALPSQPLKGAGGTGGRRVVEAYKAYLTHLLRDQKIGEGEKGDLEQLRVIVGINESSGEAIYAEIAGKMLRERLDGAIKDGVLDGAVAASLKQLQADLALPEARVQAMLVDVYKATLKAALKDELLRDSDVELLSKARSAFALAEEEANTIQREVAGAIYRRSARSMLGESMMTDEMRTQLDKLRADIRLDEEVSKAIFAEEAKNRMLQFVDKALTFSKGNMKQMASEINALTEYMRANKLEEVASARTEKNHETLKELYRTYMLYALSPEVVELPMNTHFTIGRHDFEVRNLNNVVRAFGMEDGEVQEIMVSLSSRVFRDRVDSILNETSAGKLDEEKLEELKELSKTLQLPEETAMDILKEKSTKWITSKTEEIRTKQKHDLSDIKTLQAMGVDVDRVIGERQRARAYREQVERLIERNEVTAASREKLEALRAECMVGEGAAGEAEQELVRERAQGCLVQSVAALRQGARPVVASQLETMVKFYDFAPHDVAWERRGELRQLYTAYYKHATGEGRGEPTAAQSAVLNRFKDIFSFSEDDVRDLQTA